MNAGLKIYSTFDSTFLNSKHDTMAIFQNWFRKARNYTPNNGLNENTNSNERNEENSAPEVKNLEETNSLVVNDTKFEVPKTAIERFESYVRQDFEALGRNDAITNPESNYIRLKIEAIKADMFSMGSTALLEIDESINKIDAWIEINNRFANIDTSRRLVAEKVWYQISKDRINNFLNGLKKQDDGGNEKLDDSLFIKPPITDPNIETQLFVIKENGECRKLILSYMSGAMRGIATLSYLQFLRNNQ